MIEALTFVLLLLLLAVFITAFIRFLIEPTSRLGWAIAVSAFLSVLTCAIGSHIWG